VNALYAKCKREEKQKFQFEQSVLKLTHKIESEKASIIKKQQADAKELEEAGGSDLISTQQREIVRLEALNNDLNDEVKKVKDDAEEALAQRDADKTEIEALRAKCERLEAEMNTIVDEIGFVKEVGMSTTS